MRMSAGPVVLPSVYRLGEPLGRPDQPLPTFALKSTLPDSPGFSEAALSGQQPLEMLGAPAAGIGHLNQVQDVDGYLRQEPLLVSYFGRSVPSMSLMLAAHSLNLGVGDIRLNPADGVVEVGRLKVRVSPQARMLPQFYRDRDGRPPFAIDSFQDVLSGKVSASRYAGKIVLIGATAAGLGATFSTRASPAMNPVEVVAHMTSSLLNEHFLVQPEWTRYAQFGAVLLIAALLMH